MSDCLARVIMALAPGVVSCALVAALTATLFAADFSAPGAGPAPRHDAWRVVGPGGGGTMVEPLVSPCDPKIVVEHCDMTGAYITTDNGLSWRMFNLGTLVSRFAYDPGNPSVIYAGNDALWRSEDKGAAWTMILPDPKKNTVVHMRGDHSSFDLTADDPNYPRDGKGYIDAIAIDPSNSKKVFAVVSGELLVSADYCKSWLKSRRIDGRIGVFDVDPKSGAITIITPAMIYLCDNSQWQTVPAPPGVTFEYVTAGRGSEGALVLYAVVPSKWSGKILSGGVIASKDRGKTWKDVAGPFASFAARPGEGDPPAFTSVGCCAGNADVVYAGFEELMAKGAPSWGLMGVAKTADGGKTWKIVKQEGLHPSANADVSWIEHRMEENIAKRGSPDPNVTFWPPRDIGAAPTDPDICYATDLFRTYRTLDGGKTWQTVNSVKAGDDSWMTTGLDVTTCYGVHFDPLVKNRLYISYTDIGLFRSEDNGQSWIPSTTGIPLNWRNTTYWVAFDPKVKDLLWGAFSFVHDLPRPKMWRNRDVSGYQGGVAISKDGGATWTVSSSGISETAITHIILDPDSPVGRRTLYACGFGTGVWKSLDNGATWRLRNTGIEYAEPFAWRLARASDKTLYLVVARRSEFAGADPSQDGALYKSVDGAETWTKLPLPPGCNGPNGIAVDPTDPKRLYLAAWGVENRGSHDTGGGIFLSENGGKTWVTLEDRDQHIYDVTIDPANPDTLFACGFDSAAYRSTDRGKTWQRLKGYNFKWGHRVVPDRNAPGMVYVTTFGGSVWHGPAAGDPSANDDWGMSLKKEP